MKLNPTFDGPVAGVPGAFVREVATLPGHLPDSVEIGPHTRAAPDALLFGVPDIARFLIRNGKTIEVAVEAGADRAAAQLLLHGSARGTLIHQRGELPLNAAAMVGPDGMIVAICGSSAVGKSTLAAALSRRGWRVLADGLLRVSWNGSAAIAWPSDTCVQLWRDACESAGFDLAELRRSRDGMDRYRVPLPSSAVSAPLNIVVGLRLSAAMGISELPASGRAAFLSECTFRRRQIDALGQRAPHDRILSQIARCCRAMILDGARECPIDELAERLCEAVR